jgi:hypothetical protein
MDFLAALIVVAVALGAGVYLVRPALDPQRDTATRAFAGAAALLTLGTVGLPSLRTVHPGEPLFSGEVERSGDSVAVPEGISGPVRLLVSGKLAERGEPVVTFTVSGTREPVDGKLERTFGYARIGRGGRARVAQDHDTDFFPANLADGTRSLRLERIQGQLTTPLRIAVYREPIPIPGGPYVLAALALVLAAVVDARLGWKSNLAVASGMAVTFGLLVTYNATPASAIGPAAGGVVLGAIIGSLAGWIAGALVRRVVPPVKRRPAARTGPAAA